MDNFNEKISGNYFKRKRKFRYYTAEMYHYLFFTKGKICEDPNSEDWAKGGKGMEKHINELKKLIFKPGESADVPIIGKKTAIFDPKVMPYYDYKISSKKYKNGQDCYVFSVIVKPEFQNKKEGKTVVKFLETYFEKQTFQVVAREYQLAATNAFFDFDVLMKVELTQKEGKYFPRTIEYNGVWDIPFKKPEILKFRMECLY